MEREDTGRQVDAYVDRSREELVALCARLVAAGSVNPPGHTTGPADVVRDFLAVRGLHSETLAQVEEKPNLVAATEGHGPGRHLVLNGHLDTIPPGEESEWTVPIHALTRHDGRLHGLGMGNMKGAVAAMCLAYAFLAENRGLWPGRLTLTAVADETVFGPDGALFLLEARPELLGDGLICGEGPGSLELAIAEKGVLYPGLGATVVHRMVARAPLTDSLDGVALDPAKEMTKVAFGRSLAAIEKANRKFLDEYEEKARSIATRLSVGMARDQLVVIVCLRDQGTGDVLQAAQADVSTTGN